MIICALIIAEFAPNANVLQTLLQSVAGFEPRLLSDPTHTSIAFRSPDDSQIGYASKLSIFGRIDMVIPDVGMQGLHRHPHSCRYVFARLCEIENGIAYAPPAEFEPRPRPARAQPR